MKELIIFYIILLIQVFIVLLILLIKISTSNKNKGMILENKISNMLKSNGETRIIKNIYLEKDNKTKTEIDVICINEYGIFIYESKNISGWLFGNENEYTWTQTLKGNNKYKITNPIKQNETHIKALKRIIGNDIPCYSIIVFSNRCTFRRLILMKNNYTIIKEYQLNEYIKSYRTNNTKKIEKEKADNIYNELLKINEKKFKINEF